MIALEELARGISGDRYQGTLHLPESVVLYLRHTEDMPDCFRVDICYGEQVLHYRAPIVKAQTFTLEELSSEELYLLIPFYLMRYEGQIKTGRDIEAVEQGISDLMEKITELRREGRLNAYQEEELLEYSRQVLEKLAEHSENRERLVEHMRGQVIETEAHRIYAAGIECGMELINKLIELGRNEEISKVTNDAAYRDKLISELITK